MERASQTGLWGTASGKQALGFFRTFAWTWARVPCTRVILPQAPCRQPRALGRVKRTVCTRVRAVDAEVMHHACTMVACGFIKAHLNMEELLALAKAPSGALPCPFKRLS